MTGRPGYRTMEMNGGSSAPYLACTPCVPLFVHCLIRVEAEGLLDYGDGRGSFPLYGGTFARSYSVSIYGQTIFGPLGVSASFTRRSSQALAVLPSESAIPTANPNVSVFRAFVSAFQEDIGKKAPNPSIREEKTA